MQSYTGRSSMHAHMHLTARHRQVHKFTAKPVHANAQLSTCQCFMSHLISSHLSVFVIHVTLVVVDMCDVWLTHV
jgi:hypothetical protein